MDYPDFQMRILNLYGDSQEVSDEKVCVGPATTPLVTIYGTGTIYGGFFSAQSGPPGIDDSPMILIDGVLMSGYSWAYFNDMGIITGTRQLITLTNYDTKNNYFSAVIKRNLTFNESVEMRYFNSTIFNVTVKYNLVYALII